MKKRRKKEKESQASHNRKFLSTFFLTEQFGPKRETN
jgi:hypothetical protein